MCGLGELLGLCEGGICAEVVVVLQKSCDVFCAIECGALVRPFGLVVGRDDVFMPNN